MKTKICSECKIEKNINEFSKNRTKKDKYADWCKDCMNKINKKYHVKNKYRIKEVK